MIDREAQLKEFLPLLGGTGRLGVDTEADSLYAYPEKLCLIQISLPGKDEIVDPLAGLDLSALLEVMRGRELVLHGADFDLRLLYRTYGFVPEKIFDTMWAARLLGLAEFGLRHLVERYLGIHLEKGPQKMNWSRRPLTERMEKYARNDARYLVPLSEHLGQELAEKGRLSWHEEVCARVIFESSQPKVLDLDQIWRVKGSHQLDPFALALLRELWHWREKEAREANKPPYFVLSHELLLQIAVTASRRRSVRRTIPSHIRGKRRRRLDEAIERALEIPATKYPLKLQRGTPPRLNEREQARFEELRSRRDQAAKELGIDASIVASRSDLFNLAQGKREFEERLMSWQRELLGLAGDARGKRARNTSAKRQEV